MPNRVRSRSQAVAFFAVSVLVATSLVGCASRGAPRPEAAYRANITVKMREATAEAPILERLVEFYSVGKRRRHALIDGVRVALIDRPDLRVSWMLNPAEKTFEEYRISSSEAVIATAPNPFGPRFPAYFDWIRVEEGEDQERHMYAVKGDEISGYAWLTADRIPIRFSGTVGPQGESFELEVDYSEIERGPQAAFLFGIPPSYAGYEKRKKRADASVPSDADLERLRQEGRAIPDLPRIF